MIRSVRTSSCDYSGNLEASGSISLLIMHRWGREVGVLQASLSSEDLAKADDEEKKI